EETLSDAAFAVDDKIQLFAHKVSRWLVWCDVAMRGPRLRERSARGSVGGGRFGADGLGAEGAVLTLSDSDSARAALPCGSDAVRTRRRACLGWGARCSITSRQKWPNVSNATLTPSASRASLMTRYDAPFWRNSAIPSLNGSSFAYRFCPTGLKLRAKSVKRALSDSLLVPSLIRKPRVKARTNSSKPPSHESVQHL